MFNVGGNVPVKGLLSCAEDELSIFRVDHFANHRQVYRTFLRAQPINPVNSSDQITRFSMRFQ